jgi:hypothetical protein
MTAKLSHLKIIPLLILYLLASLFIVAMIPSPLLVDERVGVIPLSNFEGYKPFQYRVLMPLVVRGIEIITPIKESIIRDAKPLIATKLTHLDQPAYKKAMVLRYVYRSVLYVGLNIVLMFLIMLALRQLMKAFDFFPKILTDLLPLALALIMPVFYDDAVFVYDFAHLLLFTLGLYYLYRRNWQIYLAVFTLGILNKETMVMQMVIFFFYYLTILPRRLFAKLLAGQALIYIVIKSGLYLAFMNNPGVFVEDHLIRNLDHLANPANYFRFELPLKGMLMPFMINIPWPRGLNIVMFGLLAFFIVYGWKSKPLFLRKAAIYFPISFILAMLWGYINELRAYYDFLPIVFILSMMGAYRMYQRLALKLIGERNAS